jgi:hypothetical protein
VVRGQREEMKNQDGGVMMNGTVHVR